LTPSFEPEAIFAALNEAAVEYVVIGGIAATLRGSPLRTGDADICPAADDANLERLATALRELGARVRLDDRTSLAAPLDAPMLAGATTWNLTTAKGDLDIAFEPSGTGGYPDLVGAAERYELEGGVLVTVASLADVIRSKEAANRPKDREALPVLRELLAQLRDGGPD
jgi:hypothetical protein